MSLCRCSLSSCFLVFILSDAFLVDKLLHGFEVLQLAGACVQVHDGEAGALEYALHGAELFKGLVVVVRKGMDQLVAPPVNLADDVAQCGAVSDVFHGVSRLDG